MEIKVGEFYKTRCLRQGRKEAEMTTELQAAASEITERERFADAGKVMAQDAGGSHDAETGVASCTDRKMSEEDLSRDAKLICHLTCPKGPVFDEVREQIEDLAKRYAGEI